MTSSRSIIRLCLPWLVLGPLLVLTGVAIGRWLPPVESAGAQWHDEDSVAQDPDGSAAAHQNERRHVGMPSLAPIVAQVAHGVVSIRTIHRKMVPHAAAAPNTLLGGESSSGVTMGTGFLIHKDGYILTSHHVVADPMVIAVRIPGLRPMQAELVGEDPITDLALIHLIEPTGPLSPLEFGDSEQVRQGDWVMTLGNPLKLQQSVGVGIVSHVSRHIQADGLSITNDYLQFTAPANPGSSGSPVFNMNGQVVGITTRAALYGQGLSFAIPTRVMRLVLRAMEDHQQVQRAYLGAAFEDVERPLHSPYAGVRITSVTAKSPAHEAGLAKDDIIIAFDDRPVHSSQDLYEWITWSNPNQRVRLEFIRDGAHFEPIEVELSKVGNSAAVDQTH